MATDPVVTIQAGSDPDTSKVTVERGDVRRLFTTKKGKEAQTLTSVLISEFGMPQPDAIAFADDQVAHAGDAAIAAAETAAALPAANERIASLETEIAGLRSKNENLASRVADLTRQLADAKAAVGRLEAENAAEAQRLAGIEQQAAQVPLSAPPAPAMPATPAMPAMQPLGGSGSV